MTLLPRLRSTHYLQRPKAHKHKACVKAVSNPTDVIQPFDQEAKALSLDTLMAGLPSWITPQFVAATQEAWTPIYGHPVTEREAIEIIQTFDRLTAILED